MQWKRMSIAVAVAVFAAVPAARGEVLYGLTNLQEIVTFDSNDRVVTSTASVSGLVDNLGIDFLVSIDVRPATGELFGLDNNSNLYVVDPTTGAATRVGDSPLNPAPTGTFRTIDFNPTVDRIRVLGQSGARTNLRVHPETGAVIEDGDLVFSSGDVNEGETPSVVNGAYTNSFAGAVTTTLYDIESANDILVTQTPANDGTLQTVGSLGLDLGTTLSFNGFDISGVTGLAYLVGNNLLGGATAPVALSLYDVNLATGAATLLGPVTGAVGTFRDIAVAGVDVAAVPEPVSAGMALLLMGGAAMRRGRAKAA